MAVDVKRLTYLEYLETPEIKQRYEILDGEMIMRPAPTLYHQGIIGRILFLLQTFITERDLVSLAAGQVQESVKFKPREAGGL
jgi:Uma2 family endonuclease